MEDIYADLRKLFPKREGPFSSVDPNDEESTVAARTANELWFQKMLPVKDEFPTAAAIWRKIARRG